MDCDFYTKQRRGRDYRKFSGKRIYIKRGIFLMSKNIFSDEYKEMIKLVENKDGSYSHSVYIQNEEEEEDVIHKEFTKIVFGGNENLVINDDAEYRSQLIDVSEYKDIEIIVNQGVRAD